MPTNNPDVLRIRAIKPSPGQVVFRAGAMVMPGVYFPDQYRNPPKNFPQLRAKRKACWKALMSGGDHVAV